MAQRINTIKRFISGNIVFQYTLVGVVFGCFFPVFSIIFEIIHFDLSWSPTDFLQDIIYVHNHNPLLYVIDSAPIFLGLFAYIGGVKQHKLNVKVQELAELEKVLRKKNSNLKQIARFDSLTQLYNRHSFIMIMASEFQCIDEEFYLFICDIDFFKKINDTYGHPGGDYVLQQIGIFFRQEFRVNDKIFRIGGEEFAFHLRACSAEQAKVFVTALIKKLAQKPLHFDGVDFKITMSIGGARFKYSDTIDGLQSRADKALYQAKENGRNQLCLTL